MKTHRPNIEFYGPVAQHDQCCPVMHNEHAVLDIESGVFHPSWKAQRKGWALIKVQTRFQRLVARVVFGIESLEAGD